MTRVLLLALLLTTLPRAAQAQDSRRAARALFQEGVVALNESRFARARDLFRRSLALFPNAGTAFNLAVAHARTGHFVEASDLYGALLDEAHGSLRAEQRREVARLRREADANVAHLALEVPDAPDGLIVRVDGERVLVGPLRLDPGEHVVVASAPRFETLERTLVLEPGATRELALGLIPSRAEGVLMVESDPRTYIEVSGHGSDRGTLRLRLPPGIYVVQLRRGRRSRDVEAVLRPGGELRLRIDVEGRRPGLWIGLAAAAAALAAGAAVVATRDQVGDPRSDEVYGVITTLRAP